MPDQYLSTDPNAGEPIKTGTARPQQPVSGRGTRFSPQNQTDNAETVAGMLPTVGGMVGGAVGAPGGPLVATTTAALGGSAGEASRQALMNAVRLARGERPQSLSGASLLGQGGMQGASQAVGGALTGGAARTGSWLMQKTVRPNPSLVQDYRTTAKKIADTLLREGVNVTEGGLAKLQRLISATNDEIKAMVGGASGSIPKDRVAAQVAPVAQRVGRQTNPTKDLEAVGATVEEFRNHPVFKGALSPADAHGMKVATYQKLGKQYGELKGAEVEAQKALARGLKDEVTESVPVVAAKNAREAELLAAGEAVSRRIAVDASADPMGLLFAASNPTLFIAGLINRQPVIKSMLARGLYQSAARASGLPENTIRAAVYALASDPEDEK